MLLSVWNYNTDECETHKIGFSWGYGIFDFKTEWGSFEDLGYPFQLEIFEDRIYMLDIDTLYVYFLKWQWTCKIKLKNLGINYATSFKVNCSKVIIYDYPLYICISINVPDDITFLMDTFGTTDYKGDLVFDSLDVYQKRILNGVVEVFADNNSCFKVNREWTIHYLRNTDIRGCNFNGAVIKTEEGEQPISEEILFNT